MCAGSGALTIQKWLTNKNLKFVCMEYDEKVISYLLFNLAIRNINAQVLHADVLSGEIFKAYKIEKGEKYSTVSEVKVPTKIKADVCISNPPYNMKWEPPIFANLQSRFQGYEIPPSNNANYAFVLSALSYADKSIFILPLNVLAEIDKINFSIRKQLIENNLIESVVINPQNMFESTDIGTCLVIFNRNKKTKKIKLLDMRRTYQTEEREQRGQFGGTSHTNRVYKKVFNIYNSECQELILKTLSENESITNFYAVVDIDSLRKNNYILSLVQYLDFVSKQPVIRPYNVIVDDLNKISALKNAVKITINEHLAKQLGIDVDNYKSANQTSKQICSNFKEMLGLKLISDDYITFSKNKNELKIELKDKNSVNVILVSFLKQLLDHIKFLSEQENIILAELRDTILPDLMSGKIDISNVDIDF